MGGGGHLTKAFGLSLNGENRNVTIWNLFHRYFKGTYIDERYGPTTCFLSPYVFHVNIGSDL